jgi:hypothetical protein
MALIRALRVPESNTTWPPRENPRTPIESTLTPGSVASQSAAFATSSGCSAPQSSPPLEGGHPRMESASATYPCSERRRAVPSTRGAPGTPGRAQPCNTMTAGSSFDVIAGRKRIPPRVTPEPGKLTSYRPGLLTAVTSVTTEVHPAAANASSNITMVLSIDSDSRHWPTVYAGRKEVKKKRNRESPAITLEDKPSQSRGPMEFQRESKAPTAWSTR